MRINLWERFSRYDNSADDATFIRLMENNHVSLTMPSGSTAYDLIGKIAEVSLQPIPIEFIPEVLSQAKFARGRVIFGFSGDAVDSIARNYDGMYWWLTEKGLNMAVLPNLHDRLATRLCELEILAPIKRGFAFEGFLDSLFEVFGLSPRKSFRQVGEQIDGSFQLHGDTYLVEAKWQTKLIGHSQLQAFAGSVRTKASWTRGVFISNSGFSKTGLTRFRFGDSTRIICVSGIDLRDVLTHKLNLMEVIERKLRRAGESGEAYVPVRTLFEIE